jgi:purine nucleosidase
MERIVIDTDPGIDDAHAIMLASAHPYAQIEALTTVAGNVEIEKATANALRILDLVKKDIPVYRGAGDGLVMNTPHRAISHGEDGLGDFGYPYSNRCIDPEFAPLALVRLANRAPGALTLVALGPLTNLAIAVKIDPELPKKFKRTVVMGGAYLSKGNSWIPAVEFNFYVDPEAAYIVLNEWDEVTIVPWETSIAYSLTPDETQKLGSYNSPRAEFFRKSITKRYVAQISGSLAIHESDSIAMMVAIEPGSIESEEYRYAQIELGGVSTRGSLVVDWYQLNQKSPNVRIVTGINKAHFLGLLEQACKIA